MPGFNIITAEGCNDAGVRNSAYNGPDPNVEIARNYRWLLEILSPFGSIRDGILLYAHKCQRPTIEVDEVVIHNSQTEIYRPGKNRWMPIELTFYEKCRGQVDEAAQRIYSWWAETMILIEQVKQNNLSYRKNASLAMLDGAGDTIWQYDLYNCWPIKISPSELDYSDTGLAEITMTLRYDKAREFSVV